MTTIKKSLKLSQSLSKSTKYQASELCNPNPRLRNNGIRRGQKTKSDLGLIDRRCIITACFSTTNIEVRNNTKLLEI